MKALCISTLLALVLSVQSGLAADAMNAPYGTEPYLTDDLAGSAQPGSTLSNRGKFVAAVALIILITVIFYWKPRRLKPGSYRFYPSSRTQKRPQSHWRQWQ